MPIGRAEMGGDSGCGIAMLFLLLVLIGICIFSRFLIPPWLWQLF